MTDDQILERIDLDRHIESLPDFLREAVSLYREGYSWADIARMLGMHHSTFRYHMRKAGFANMPSNSRGKTRLTTEPAEKSYGVRDRAFNDDPKWARYVESLEPLIHKIVRKFTKDEDLRNDCKQIARIALMQVFPEKVRTNLKSYCGNVIRNRTLSYLASYSTGDWQVGRTRADGTFEDCRHQSLEVLMDMGMEVDTDSVVTWESVNRLGDGMSNED